MTLDAANSFCILSTTWETEYATDKNRRGDLMIYEQRVYEDAMKGGCAASVGINADLDG